VLHRHAKTDTDAIRKTSTRKRVKMTRLRVTILKYIFAKTCSFFRTHARVLFQHAEYDFHTLECDLHAHECDLDTLECGFYTQSANFTRKV
jgi:hypothetical protein